MFTSGTAPPSGVKLSCARSRRRSRCRSSRRRRARRRRRRSAPPCPPCSPPSAPSASMPRVARRSRSTSRARPSAIQSTNIAANSAQPWRWSPTSRPNVYVSANGIASSAKISTRFVKPVGFSNGCAEFALTSPPPFVPSSLIASWLAIGPPVDRLRRARDGRRLGEAAEVLDDALAREHERDARPRAAAARASSTRVRSTQKLPIVAERRRDEPADERDRDGDARRRPRRSSAPSARPSA